MEIFEMPNVEFNISQLNIMSQMLRPEEFRNVIMAVVESISKGLEPEVSDREKIFYRELYPIALKRAKGWQGRSNAGKARKKSDGVDQE